MTPWTENNLLIHGVQIHSIRTGHGEKPALVLLHGFSGSGWSWFETARALEADFDLVLPDMRGHGQSQSCARGEQTDLTGDLAGLITALGLEKPIVGGHSLGANYAARVAACHPELVGALLLVDPCWYTLPEGVPDEPRPPSDDDAPPGESTYDRWLARMTTIPLQDVMDELRTMAPHKNDAALRRWAETLHGFDTNFFTTEDISQIHFPQLLSMIQCPSLVITGEVARGAIVGAPLAKWIVEQNPKFEIAHVPGAGHNLMEDNFEAYLQAMQGFLARFQRQGTALQTPADVRA